MFPLKYLQIKNMLSFEKQKNKMSQFKKVRKYKVSILGLNPKTDWKIVLLGVLVVVVIVVVNGLSVYKDIVEISEKEIDVEVDKGESVDIDLVNERISYFKSKQAVLDTMFFNPETAVPEEGDEEDVVGEREIEVEN